MPSPLPAVRPELSPRYRTFCLAYLRGASITDAALEAGYGPNPDGARATGCRILRNPSVRVFLAGRIRKCDIELDTLVLEIARQAYEDLPDMGAYLDAQGNPKPLDQLTLTQRRALAGVDVVKRNLSSGDRAVETVVKIRLVNVRAERTKAAQLLAEVMGWLRHEPPPIAIAPIFQIAGLPALTPAAAALQAPHALDAAVVADVPAAAPVDATSAVDADDWSGS